MKQRDLSKWLRKTSPETCSCIFNTLISGHMIVFDMSRGHLLDAELLHANVTSENVVGLVAGDDVVSEGLAGGNLFVTDWTRSRFR